MPSATPPAPGGVPALWPIAVLEPTAPVRENADARGGADANRYVSLDAWRGVAALAVALYHCSTVLEFESAPLALALSWGWAGVFVFFPISGYAILAATDRRQNAGVRSFLARRWRRIFLPYWASIALAVGVALAALPFNRGSLGELLLPVGTWAAVLTLTQTVVGHPSVVNPVYWSLCYEEQFYIVVALTLLAPSRYRIRALSGVSVAAAAYWNASWPIRVPGLFLEYWPCFAVGVVCYAWLRRPEERGWALVMAAATAAAAWQTPDEGLLISIAAGVLFVALARFDRAFAATGAGRGLIALGAISYSLYLVHVPIGGRVVNLLTRAAIAPETAAALGVVASLVAAVVFYRLVERPSRTAPEWTPRPAAF